MGAHVEDAGEYRVTMKVIGPPPLLSSPQPPLLQLSRSPAGSGRISGGNGSGGNSVRKVASANNSPSQSPRQSPTGRQSPSGTTEASAYEAATATADGPYRNKETSPETRPLQQRSARPGFRPLEKQGSQRLEELGRGLKQLQAMLEKREAGAHGVASDLAPELSKLKRQLTQAEAERDGAHRQLRRLHKSTAREDELPPGWSTRYLGLQLLLKHGGSTSLQNTLKAPLLSVDVTLLLSTAALVPQCSCETAAAGPAPQHVAAWQAPSAVQAQQQYGMCTYGRHGGVELQDELKTLLKAQQQQAAYIMRQQGLRSKLEAYRSTVVT
ncbi:hypothetical protein JKP88DRAFT_241160 [Tribonema minus]|uniref:Uncharacterized protein n=1 Tax=Tribonema minus TaxID=303371 RepID=A0A836CF26_9STRA|nr:hypothetical protein JKP88DRAFT_241160 [Tribonema minus]